MKKSFSILKGIGWVVSKMGFLKKCGDTITAFLESLEDFEIKCHIIWDKPKTVENEKTKENINLSSIAVVDADIIPSTNEQKATERDKKQ